MMTLSEYLKVAGITQETFAQLLDCKQATVSRLASGVSTPTLELAWRIEKATDRAVTLYSWIDPRELKVSRGDYPDLLEVG